MASLSRQIPETPHVIAPSPTPTPSEISSQDSYFAPITRSTTRKRNKNASAVAEEEGPNDPSEPGGSDPESRARSRSRGEDTVRQRRLSGLSAVNSKASLVGSSDKLYRKSPQIPATTTTINNHAISPDADRKTNGHLSPSTAYPTGLGAAYWRSLSRSPSPLGLIPIHRSWRTFIHRHEIPRKALHVSIGFLTLFEYQHGIQTSAIHPVLLRLLIPIAVVDVARHNIPSFNAIYIRALGAFMRESEAHDRYNGVIWYLAGAWTVLRFCPKDIAVVSILLLSWCDTAASTFGRLWGRYTPRIRRGKSLAGSAAAFTVGVGTAVLFWGIVAPLCEQKGWVDDTGTNAFAFRGSLGLPRAASGLLGTAGTELVNGSVALGVVSVWAGLVASASEAVDIFGWDDNVTIPILCGVGLWGFLKVFGSVFPR